MGPNALTVASHIVMVVVLAMLAVRVMRGSTVNLNASLAIMAAAFGMERIYYILARFLRPHGVDLWQMHPAPEVLSVIVGIGVYSVMVPMVLLRSVTLRAARVKVACEVAALSGLWVFVAWGLF